MPEKNQKCQHSGSTSMSKNVTNHTIFQPRKSELFDMKNRSSITLSQKTLVSSDRKVCLRYPKITDTFEHSINDHSMSEENDTSQHSGSTSGSKNGTNHTIFQPRKSEFFDTKNRSSITLSQKTLVSSDRKVHLHYPKITDTFEHSINDHSMSEKNDTSQHSGSTSGSKNGTNQNSLT